MRFYAVQRGSAARGGYEECVRGAGAARASRSLARDAFRRGASKKKVVDTLASRYGEPCDVTSLSLSLTDALPAAASRNGT